MASSVAIVAAARATRDDFYFSGILLSLAPLVAQVYVENVVKGDYTMVTDPTTSIPGYVKTAYLQDTLG